MRSSRKSLVYTLLRSLCLILAVAGSTPLPSAAAELPGPEATEFHPVVLGSDGQADEKALEALTASVGRDVAAGSTQVVVMIHGFNNDYKWSARSYNQIGERLRKEAGDVGLRTSLVGVHWDAHPKTGAWVLKAAGNRFTSLLGFRNAVKNPYLEKCGLARQTGRTGLRSVLFRLQDRFPKVPIHLFAHSLGAEVALSALAPECQDSGGPGGETEQPGRELRVGLVTLAGADLDYNAFCRKSAAGRRAGLRRAQVWWVTVAEPDQADGVLEMRRGAGKPDAVGNRGLELTGQDLDYLLSRRALVVDTGDVPADHRITSYFGKRRLQQLAASLLYLERPSAPAARTSVLATLDGILKEGPKALATGDPRQHASVKMYSSWKTDPASGFDRVRVIDPRSVEAVAGSRQETTSR